MKKIFYSMMAMAMSVAMMGLTACGDDDEEVVESASNSIIGQSVAAALPGTYTCKVIISGDEVTTTSATGQTLTIAASNNDVYTVTYQGDLGTIVGTITDATTDEYGIAINNGTAEKREFTGATGAYSCYKVSGSKSTTTDLVLYIGFMNDAGDQVMVQFTQTN